METIITVVVAFLIMMVYNKGIKGTLTELKEKIGPMVDEWFEEEKQDPPKLEDLNENFTVSGYYREGKFLGTCILADSKRGLEYIESLLEDSTWNTDRSTFKSRTIIVVEMHENKMLIEALIVFLKENLGDKLIVDPNFYSQQPTEVNKLKEENERLNKLVSTLQEDNRKLSNNCRTFEQRYKEKDDKIVEIQGLIQSCIDESEPDAEESGIF